MINTNSLVKDLKSRLKEHIPKVYSKNDDGIILIRENRGRYLKDKDLMIILWDKPIIIYYYDKKFERILKDLQKSYSFKYNYITQGYKS